MFTILGLLCRRSFSPTWVNNTKLSSHNITPPVQERLSSVFPTGGTHQPGQMFQTKHADVPLQKRTRSPTLPTATVFSSENNRSDGHKRLAGKLTFTKGTIDCEKWIILMAIYLYYEAYSKLWFLLFNMSLRWVYSELFSEVSHWLNDKIVSVYPYLLATSRVQSISLYKFTSTLSLMISGVPSVAIFLCASMKLDSTGMMVSVSVKKIDQLIFLKLEHFVWVGSSFTWCWRAVQGLFSWFWTLMTFQVILYIF